LADISQYIKIEKIENLRYFSQARWDEDENFISVGFEGHSVIWHKNFMKNIKIVKSHNFDNLKYLCNQTTDLDETAIKLLRKFYFITLAIQIAQKFHNNKFDF
jgi:hypothetical protein